MAVVPWIRTRLTLDGQLRGKGVGAEGILGQTSVIPSVRLFGGLYAQDRVFFFPHDPHVFRRANGLSILAPLYSKGWSTLLDVAVDGNLLVGRGGNDRLEGSDDRQG